MTAAVDQLCEGCKQIKPIAFRDTAGRGFCASCERNLPTVTMERIVDFLMETMPFAVGDRVEARTAGVLFDGVGVIDEISIDPEKFGTPAFPSFHVVIEEKAHPDAPDSLWYMETQLRRAEA